MPLFIVLFGSLGGGFTAEGPFSNLEEARRYAESDGIVMPMAPAMRDVSIVSLQYKDLK